MATVDAATVKNPIAHLDAGEDSVGPISGVEDHGGESSKSIKIELKDENKSEEVSDDKVPKTTAAPVTPKSTEKKLKAKATPKKRGSTSTSTGNDDTTNNSKMPGNKAANGVKSVSPKKRGADTNGNEVEATPTKKKRSPPKAKKEVDANGDNVNEETGGISLRKRQPAENPIATPRGIPKSWQTASEADRMLVTMKDAGKNWDEIRKMWKDLTSQEAAYSTLPNRYNRLKANWLSLNEGDADKLLSAKKAVEARFKSEMWLKIAEEMEKNGAARYTTLFLEKEFKQLIEQQQKNKSVSTTTTTTTSSLSSPKTTTMGFTPVNGGAGATINNDKNEGDDATILNNNSNNSKNEADSIETENEEVDVSINAEAGADA